jgi:hypothetical protein
MAARTTGDPRIDALYAGRRGRVDFVDVPELGYAAVDGTGAPDGPAFAHAIGALYAVSYGAHFALKKTGAEAPRVMPLETLWWVEGADAQRTMELIGAGEAEMAASDRSSWRWRALIVQLDPLDEDAIQEAIAAATAKGDAAVGEVRHLRWAEGRCAQVLHVGPYAAEQPTIVALHSAIAGHGDEPIGRHHEIYLGDPLRSAPDKLRTLIRQPVRPRNGESPTGSA